MTDYVELPSDALLDHEQPGASVQPGRDYLPGEQVDEEGNHYTLRPDGSKRLIVDITGGGSTQPESKSISPNYQDLPQDAQLDGQQPGIGQQILQGLGAGVRDIGGGTGQLLNTVTSPVKATLNALGLPGGDTDYEKVADHIADQLGLEKTAPVQQAIQRGIVSGLLTAGVAAPVAAAAPIGSATSSIAGALSTAPLTEAAAAGASSGAGEATKEAGYGQGAQLAAQLAAGGLVGAGGARAGAARDVVQDGTGDVAQAAQRLGIDVLPADVGGATVRRLTSAAAQAPLSASPIINASQRVLAQAKSVRDRLASSIGSALDPEAAGDQARSGAQAYINSSRAEKNAAYDLAERAAGNTPVTPAKAMDVLDRNISELSETVGGAPAVERLQALRDELVKRGTVSVQGLRNTRTVLRQEFIKDGLRGSDTERRVNQVLDAAKDDIVDSLKAQGKGKAAQLYAKADALNAQRSDTIDKVLLPIIGTKDKPKSSEAIIRSLMGDLQGNNGRAVRFLNALPEAEKQNTRASIISALGKTKAGAQNAEGDAFSLAQFLTDWNKLGKTAKRAYFGDEASAALNDLATVAGGVKEASRYANFSNTAGGIWGNLGILASGAVASPVSAGAGLATQLIGGRLLASPRFARWLARAPRTQLSRESYVDRLTRIAAAEPAISGDIMSLKDQLNAAFHQPALAANPQGQPDNGRNGDGQQ